MKEIPKFPGYFATKDGRIWSASRIGTWRNGKFLKPWVNRWGYELVDLCKKGKVVHKQVHRLILETFLGRCPTGKVTCHNDGNKRNNCLKNLRWDTRSSNELDKKKHGTDNHPSKLSRKQVRTIKSLLKRRIMTQEKIAKMFEVTQTAISDIKTERTWACI